MTSFGCNNCTYLKGHQCRLWQVKVKEPIESSCESGHNGDYQRLDIPPVKDNAR